MKMLIIASLGIAAIFSPISASANNLRINLQNEFTKSGSESHAVQVKIQNNRPDGNGYQKQAWMPPYFRGGDNGHDDP